nr:MFS transporter [Lysinibacillus halotolerans]
MALVAAVVSYFVLPNVEQKLNVPAGRPNQNTFHQLISSFKVPYFVFLIVVFTFSFGIANYQATMSLYLDDKFQYTPFLISVIFTVGGFAGVILQLFWMDKLFLRFGEMKIILFHLVVASITLVLLIYVNGFFIILTVASLNMIAATFIRPAVNTAISKMAGDEQGFAAGMNNAYMSLGNMVGPICAGMLYDWKIDSPYLFGAFVLFSCFILTYFWSMKKSAQQKLQSSNP